MACFRAAKYVMDSRTNNYQIISDYAVFLKALLPEIVGSCCHDRKGRLFWEDQGTDTSAFPDQHQQSLRQILKVPREAGKIGKLGFNDATAYIVPLVGSNDKVLGALTILVDPAIDLSYEACLERVRSVVKTLKREMSLRYRLVTSYRQLSVHSAEENLLHQVEKLVHLNRPCENTLSHILLLCRRFLSVQGAVLFIPARDIRLFEGDTLKPAETQLMLSEMAEQYAMLTHDPLNTQEDIRFRQDQDVLALPIGQGNNRTLGVFALTGWAESDFSARRRRRIGRYVAALIEDVIARDYDVLTGLMSWATFEAELLDTCQTGDAEGRFCLYFDIDQLHVFNETFGLGKGDEVLAAFAGVMREGLDTNLMTRITGDRFTALLSDVNLEGARAQAEEVSRRFNEREYVRGDQTLRPTVSVGIGPVSAEVKVASAVMARAQVACQAAKERGRGRVETFQTGDESIMQRFDDIHLVGHIRSAIENDRLMLDVQPIVNLHEEGTTFYYEVLVRLLSSSGQQVLPGDFFSAAERYQLMEQLDRWVVTKTLRSLSERMDRLRDLPLRIAINLSGQSLGSRGFLKFVEKTIAKYDVPAEMLCFEMTETVAVANQKRALVFMQELKKLGCRFALDDFGTGLSSFAYLKMFPLDTIKIDGSFVHDITTNVTSQSVVAAIAEVARVMQLETVGEYVQHEDTKKLLKDLGVTWGQGFLLGAPEPMIARLDMLADQVEAVEILA